MRKSRISFSISKKSNKNEGGESTQPAVPEVTPSNTKEPTLKPSNYFACRFCCKRFKSEKTYETHSKTKNHLKAVKTGTASELTKSRTCAGCQQSFESRLQLTEHCKRFSHMPLVQKTTLKDPVYGKAYTESEQEDPFVSIKYYSPYYCEVCDLDCVCDVHYQDHVKGARHKKAVEKRAEQGSVLLVDLDTNEVDTSEKCLVIMNKVEPITETVSAYYCGICDTDCRSELAYTEHVTSKDHQIRMEGHGQLKISCDLCCMTFTSENNYKMHLKSKKHASNEAARQRLLPLEVQESEKSESFQDLRDKIKRTLSPPLENFDKIKINVAAISSEEIAVRSVMITDEEIEADEAPFMEMGKPNVGNNNRKNNSGSKDKKDMKTDMETKLKEDELERGKWAKKKEDDYARRKAVAEKESEKKRSRWDSGERHGPSPRGRGRGGRGRGRGRGGRFTRDAKFTWVNPLYDDTKKSSKSSKDDSHRDRHDRKTERKGQKGDKSNQRDGKADRRERRRSYDDERDKKKYDGDSEEEYKERVILKKGERKRERSVNSDDDDDDDLRNVINKQRGKAKESTEKTPNFADDDYGKAGEDDGQKSLVFDYAHQRMNKGETGEDREVGDRAELKGFFGGALADYFEGPGYEGAEELPRDSERYYEEQRAVSAFPRSQPTFEKVPEVLEQKELTEKTLLLELLKRQFPDIRYLMDQQGGAELMQRIFGGGAVSDLGGGVTAGDGSRFSRGGVRMSGNGGGVEMGGDVGGVRGDGVGGFERVPQGLDSGRRVYAVPDREEVGDERGFQRRVLADSGAQTKDGRAMVGQLRGQGRSGLSSGGPVEDIRIAQVGGKHTNEPAQMREVAGEKKANSGRERSPDVGQEKPRGGKKEPEKSSASDKRGSKKERKRSRSRSRSKDKRKRSRSRSSSRGRSKYKSTYRKRSRSSSRERSSSKKSKRTPSPARSSKKDDTKSTKRKSSVSPKRGDKQKTEKKDGDEAATTRSPKVEKVDKKGDKGDSAVSQVKAKSKDAKEKVLAKWTVSNWSGKDDTATTVREKEEATRKRTDEKDKNTQKDGSKKRNREDEEETSASDKERSARKKSTDRAEQKTSSDQDASSSRSKKGSKEKNEKGKSGAKEKSSEINTIFDDASDYEDIPLDDLTPDRDLKEQFERDYDEMPESPVERRRDRVDERDLRLSRQSQATSLSMRSGLIETTAKLGRTVPSVEEVRKSIPLTLTGADDAEFDPYSYESRAFEAQEDSDDRPLPEDPLATLARGGIPHQNLGYERLTRIFPSARDYMSTAVGITSARLPGIPPGREPALASELAPGYELIPGHGLRTSHGSVSRLGFPPGRAGNLIPVGAGPVTQRELGLGHGLAPGSGLELEAAVGRGTVGIRGRNVRGRGGVAGPRNNSALMYIQPTEDSKQVRVGLDERAIKLGTDSRLTSTQTPVVRGTTERNITTTSSVLRTISPVPVVSRPLSGKQDRLPLSSPRIEQQIRESPMENRDDEDRTEGDFPELSDSDQYSSDMTTSKPLKSILKKQSKFSPVDVARNQASEVEVSVSGNLPKNAVGAEYVVQSSGEQGKFFCQLCDVQFATLSAKNLHLRGPKHLAMFMKHKSPLIDQMIRQAMGGIGRREKDDTPPTEDGDKGREVETHSVRGQPGQEWRVGVAPPEQERAASDRDTPSPHSLPERGGLALSNPTKKPRETEMAESSVRGHQSDISYTGRRREGIVDEPRLYIDEKTGRIIQADPYYDDNLSIKSGGSQEKYEQTPTSGRDYQVRAGGEYAVPSRDEYRSLLPKHEYGQIPAKQKDLLPRDDYGRFPLEGGRGLPVRREEYDTLLRIEGRQDYGRLPARDTGLPPRPEDFGRLPPRERLSREDYDRFLRREVPSSEVIGRPLLREEFGRPSSKESHTEDRDWRSGRLDRLPTMMREGPGDKLRDWSNKYGESHAVGREPVPTNVAESGQYATPGKDRISPSGDWASGRADTKQLPQTAVDEPREVSRRTTDSPTGLPKFGDEQESREPIEKQRETPERYSSGYESRLSGVIPGDGREELGDRRNPPGDRRTVPGGPDDVYGQPSYREQFDRGYGSEERYRTRESMYDRPAPSRDDRLDPLGYSYEAARRGRGSRGRGGPSMTLRGSNRGYPRKLGFSRPPRPGWKGQGRY